MDKNKIDAETKEAKAEAFTDDSFGGCKYRVSYDRYEGKIQKRESRISAKSIVAGIIAFIVFFLIGFLIVRYYNNYVGEYNKKSDESEITANAIYQSFTFIDEQ